MKEALKYLQAGAIVPVDMETTILLVNALKEALAQPAQEPVACIHKGHLYMAHEFMSRIPDGATLLYTTPPQRQPLTDEQIEDIAAQTMFPINFARAIEAAHGIKENT